MLAYILGYGVALLLSTAILYPTMSYLFSRTKDSVQLQLHWLAASVGFIERVIYVNAVVFGYHELIAIWLVMKTLLEFKAGDSQSVASFYVYLIGTSLSLIFGVMGGQIVLALR